MCAASFQEARILGRVSDQMDDASSRRLDNGRGAEPYRP